MYCPHLLGRSYQLQEISQQVVTKMQDLASEVSNISGVVPSDPHSGMRRPPPVPNTQPGLWPGAG